MPFFTRRPLGKTLNFQTLRIFTYTYTLTLLYISAPYLYITRYHASLYGIRGASMSPTLSPAYHETGQRDQVIFWKNIRAPETKTSPRTHDVAEETEGLDLRQTTTQEIQKEEEEEEEATNRKVNPKNTTTTPLTRGQIIAFHTPHQPTMIAVKRIVALAGDVVRPLRRNGSPYYPHHHHPHHHQDSATEEGTRPSAPPDNNEVTVTIPFNHAWVEGDNPDQSLDSNDYGPISLSLVEGVAGRIVWPVERRGARDWTRDGWEGRCGGRIEWRGRGREGVVPEQWDMYEY